jgi:hypothetical protein
MADLGSQFRASREQLGFTLHDVSRRTKIPRQLLADLEMNNLTRWPKPRVYRIGFIRAYASEVGLDADRVVAQFVAETPPSTVGSATSERVRARARAPVAALLALALCLSSALLVGLSRQIQVWDPVASPGPRLGDIQLEPTATATSGISAPSSADALVESGIEGELQIDSNPTGAWVTVNGIARGRTPLRIQYLPVGSYTIRLVHDGYQSEEQSVSVTARRPVQSISMLLHERVRDHTQDVPGR